jgi:hypothetical protein
MTPEQKELIALQNIICSYDYSRISKQVPHKRVDITVSEIEPLVKAAQAYADHFATIKAIESGEWVLMPVKPTGVTGTHR